MAKKLIKISLLLFLLLLLSGCKPPPKPIYYSDIIYFKPNGEIFKEYNLKSSLPPRLDFNWDGRGNVQIGPLPIQGLPDIPQGWLVEIKTRKSYE